MIYQKKIIKLQKPTYKLSMVNLLVYQESIAIMKIRSYSNYEKLYRYNHLFLYLHYRLIL